MACCVRAQNQKDVAQIRAVLDQHNIYYLYEPNTSWARPNLTTARGIHVGLTEITEVAECMAADRKERQSSDSGVAVIN